MTTTTVNEALVQLDNIITATNYLLEELQTRKNQFLQKENLVEEVKTAINHPDFKEDIVYYVQNSYGSGICREVAFYVMERIDSDIEAFINDRVNKAISAAGVELPQQ